METEGNNAWSGLQMESDPGDRSRNAAQKADTNDNTGELPEPEGRDQIPSNNEQSRLEPEQTGTNDAWLRLPMITDGITEDG